MQKFYVVATPIGNLEDITYRAVRVLSEVDLILCEDTRVSGKLLAHYQIAKPAISFNDFNEKTRTPKVIDDLKNSKNIALVSDAGTPLISDPGFHLVREAVRAGIRLESIPGPSAAIAALTLSGLPCDKFLFVGYLPKKEGRRRRLLETLDSIIKILPMTIILYESPHRLLKTFADIQNVFGDIDIVICRELTKLHQEIRREKISQSIGHFLEIKPKGELTIVFNRL